MNRFFICIILLFPSLTLLSCRNTENNQIIDDNKSYINKFELIQKNSKNNTIIKITSPKAIIDPTNSDIEVLDSSIELYKNNSQNLKIISGKSYFNNKNNFLSVNKNVYITLFDDQISFIKTNSFDWDLNTSNINLHSPLDVNFNNATLAATNGSYNIDSNVLNISNNVFNKNIYNQEGKELYKIEIISDKINWFNESNLIEFSSIKKQVYTKINFLGTK